MQFGTLTPGDWDIGPCFVEYDGADLGGTQDGVVISVKYDKAKMSADQTGTLKVDEAVSGMEITLKTSFLETRRKALWAILFPTATYAGTAPADYLDYKDQVSLRSLSRAKKIVLKPKSEDATDKNLNHTFWKALAMEESVLTFGPAEQRKLAITFSIFPDTSVTPWRLYRFGDDTL
jgi:hypothetical protein